MNVFCRFYGHQAFGELLRVHSAIFAVLHHRWMEGRREESTWKENCLGTIHEELIKVARYRGHVNNFSMEASAFAFDVEIYVLYPYIEGRTSEHLSDICSSHHNAGSTKMKCNVMWTVDSSLPPK